MEHLLLNRTSADGAATVKSTDAESCFKSLNLHQRGESKTLTLFDVFLQLGIPFAVFGVFLVIACLRRPIIDTRPR